MSVVELEHHGRDGRSCNLCGATITFTDWRCVHCRARLTRCGCVRQVRAVSHAERTGEPTCAPCLERGGNGRRRRGGR